MSESESAPESVERELFFGMAADRLRRRCRWAAVVLLLSFAIPYEHVDGVPQFLWQLLDELPPAAILAAFSTSLAGVAILVATLGARRASTLAVIVLASLATARLLEQLGADRAAWDVLPLPESLAGRPLAMLLGLSSVGAGMNLAFKPHTRRAGRITLIAAAVLIAGFYLWPARGEAPVTTIFRVLLWLPALPGLRFVLGYSLILLVATFPAFVAALGLFVALSPPHGEPRMMSRLAIFGFPGLLGFFVFRSLLLTLGDSSLPATVGGVALLAALLGAVSAAVEVLVEVGVLRGHEPGSAAPAPLRIAAGASAGALVVLGAGQWLLARPPDKGVDWKLAAPSPAGDAAFGETLESWSRVRLRWDDRVRDASSASAMVELKAAERELRQRAKLLDPGVHSAIVELVSESQDLDLAGRRWFRLVADVNEANRAAGAPYYVDPSVILYQTPDGLRRRFGVHGYRIERVRPVRVGSQSFATLHVRRLGTTRAAHGKMGFSRDLQPFALVVLDEIEPVEKQFAELAAAAPPSCDGSTSPVMLSGLLGSDVELPVGPPIEADRAMLACGQALAEIVHQDRARLLPALVAQTERHELQHQIDGPHLPMSEAVLARMGGYTRSAQELVNRELSAYVAELTTPDASPKLGLVTLMRFTRARPRSALHHIAALAAAALADRDPDDDALDPGAIYAELLAEDDAALRARAAEAWEHLYDTELPEIHAAS